MTTIYADFEYVFDSVDFGIDVRNWRTKHGMTQADFADAMGGSYTGSYVSMMETANLSAGLPMRTFLVVCNLIDKSPFCYFALQRVVSEDV